MSYRKITVDGFDYKYTVGRNYVKVRGIGTWFKHEVGYVIDDYEVRVQPYHIAAKIREVVGSKS